MPPGLFQCICLMPKYLFHFSKGESVRWLGHLDILRTFERAIRRSNLPALYSGGFNPRIKLTFASALSVGITGNEEPATLELTEQVHPEQVMLRLNAALPPGIRIGACRELLEQEMRDILNRYVQAAYEVTCSYSEETDLSLLENAIETLLKMSEIQISREREGRAKIVNIRPFLHSLSTVDNSITPGRLDLFMILGMSEGKVARPGEVISALAKFIPGVTLRRACRLRLISFSDSISLTATEVPSQMPYPEIERIEVDDVLDSEIESE